jgi:hypothetical protein
VGAGDWEAMPLYSVRDGAVRPVVQNAMPRLPCLYASGGTMHLVARCDNREFYLGPQEDFQILLDHALNPRLVDRDTRWASQRAVGSPEFLKRYHPSGRRRGIFLLPEQIRRVGK